MKTLRVLTIREPWASLIGLGIKKIETRSWSTSYRGTLYIHAGKNIIPKNDARRNKGLEYLKDSPLHYGEIFLKCTLVDCIQIDDEFAQKVNLSDPINYFCGNYKVGRYAWVLENITYIKPIPAAGHLSIWKYNE
ncbi:MAG: ASCH domain-containing protein [Ruminococcus sp.]|uniref:ASCH domain-containing protein n=1 Tax=Ruminococcus sp. TaxID=41978 RepID=UPI0025F139EB|nr:ASCH domain-containing protein [Ruminococcus sp.]MCR5540670.1 ASCH domain-containing protein [Ruminococcus sp.]